jgi:cytidine deaminase
MSTEISKKDFQMLDHAISIAVNMRAMARTFRSSVGTCLVTKDLTMFGGCNLETYGHKGYHAEEMSLLAGLKEGYNGTDFDYLVEIFQDAGHDKVEIFPACLSCWTVLWEFTHPDLRIVCVDTKGEPRYTCKLGDIIHPPPPGEVFPSDLVRQVKPKLNIEPRLP